MRGDLVTQVYQNEKSQISDKEEITAGTESTLTAGYIGPIVKADLKDAKPKFEEERSLESCRLPLRAIAGLLECKGNSIQYVAHNARHAKYAFDKIIENATTTSQPTTVKALTPVVPGVSAVSVTVVGANMTQGRHIQVGTAGTDSEIRKISSIVGDVLNVDRPFRLAHAAGADVVLVGNGADPASVVTHKYTYETTASKLMDLLTYSLQHVFYDPTGTALVRQWNGCKVTAIEFAGDEAGKLTIKVEFDSMKVVKLALTDVEAITQTSNNAYMFKDATVTLNGVDTGKVAKFDIKIKIKTDSNAYYDSDNTSFVGDISSGKVDITATVVVKVSGTTYLDYILTNSGKPADQSVSVAFSRGANDTLTFALAGTYVAVQHDTTKDGDVECELSYSSATNITVTEVNSTAAN